VIDGYKAIRSARLSKFSGRHLNENLTDKMTLQTLIPVDVAAIAMCYRLAGEVATKDNHLGYETIFDAIVKHLLQSRKGLRMV